MKVHSHATVPVVTSSLLDPSHVGPRGYPLQLSQHRTAQPALLSTPLLSLHVCPPPLGGDRKAGNAAQIGFKSKLLAE